MINFADSLSLFLLNASEKRSVWWSRLMRILFWGIGGVSVLYLLSIAAGFTAAQSPWFGLSLLGLALMIAIFMDDLYYAWHIKQLLPEVSLVKQAEQSDWVGRVNLADYFSLELARVVRASLIAGRYDFGQLVEKILQEKTVTLILTRAGVATRVAERKVAPPVQEPLSSVEALIQHAALRAAKSHHRHIHLSHVLTVLAIHDQKMANLLFERSIDLDDLLGAIKWFEDVNLSITKKHFWETGRAMGFRIGRDWSAGYTPVLSHFTRDLGPILSTQSIQLQVASRVQAIDQLERALLSSDHSQVVLIGPTGVGKREIIKGLAGRIFEGVVSSHLRDKKIVELDAPRLLAGASSQSKLEARIIKVLDEARSAGNIILFIDNIQNLFSHSSKMLGAADIANILLTRIDKLALIATADLASFQTLIAPKSGGRFTQIVVDPPSEQEAVIVLEEVALYIEEQYKVFITYPALVTVVHLANRYLKDTALPDSAVKVLEAAAIQASYKDNKVIGAREIKETVSATSRIPIGEIKTKEKEILLHLEDRLHEMVIGQDEAVAAISTALRRVRAGVGSRNKPIGSFLFFGPTGVGKTQTARALAQIYFGSTQNMVRLDMSEFQSPASLSRLIGSSTEVEGRSVGELTGAIQSNPFSLVLLDEIEKAHPNILNVFLQILDEGRATGGLGTVVDFTNTIIIATSNAGSEIIREKVKAGQKIADFKQELVDYLQKQGIFKPELLNRFDALVAFHPLTKNHLVAIVNLLLMDINKRLSKKNIKVLLTQGAKNKIVDLGYNPEFGARALQRVMQERIENMIAEQILAGQIKAGETITLDETDFNGST